MRLSRRDEESHLVQVRAWLTAAIHGQAGLAPAR